MADPQDEAIRVKDAALERARRYITSYGRANREYGAVLDAIRTALDYGKPQPTPEEQEAATIEAMMRAAKGER